MWPADVHLVGKDILRFHAVIWPAMLMAAGLAAAASVFAHGWLLVGGEKMSKSKLTGIQPQEIVDVFGSDAFRYYFLRAIEFGQDGSFSWEDLSARYKAELADQLGNLASRLTSMVGRYREGVLPAPVDEPELATGAATAVETAEAAIDRLDLQGAILAAMDYVRVVNNYVTEQEPWKVAKDESRGADLDRILYATAEALRVVAVLLHPVMPKASTMLWQLARRRGRRSARSPTPGCRTLAAGASCRPGRRSPSPSRCSRASRSPSRREPRRARPGRAGAGLPDLASGRRRRSRSGCRWPTATATSTSPTRRTTGCRSRTHSPGRLQPACRASFRSAATCPGRGGRSRRPARTSSWWPASPCTPTRRRCWPAPAPSTRPSPRSTRWLPTPSYGLWGRPASTTSAPARTDAPTRRRRSARTSRWPSGTARRWSSTTATRTTTCCACSRTPAPPTGSSSTASPATSAMAEHCAARGYWLSFAGPVTFKNAPGLRAALAVAPTNRLLVETDAPYLTPVPYRGRPNASYLIPHTLRAMAEVKGVDEDTLATAIAASTEAAFGTW